MRRGTLLNRWPRRRSRSTLGLRRRRFDFLLGRFLSWGPAGSGMYNLWLRGRGMVDLWRWPFDFLLRRLSLPSRWLARSGVYNPGLRSRSMVRLWRWGFDFLLRRWDHLSRRLARRGMWNTGLGSRSLLDLWRRRFGFLLRRRHVHFGSRFSDSRRLTMGGRRWSRLWRGDFSRGCFCLGGWFRRCHVRRLRRRR